jgi:hypothetical protein
MWKAKEEEINQELRKGRKGEGSQAGIRRAGHVVPDT